LGPQAASWAERLLTRLCGEGRQKPDGPQRVLALADGARAPGRTCSTCAGDVAPLRWSLPRAGGTGSDPYLLKPDLPRHAIQTQTDGPWRDPDAAKGVRSACPCLIGAEPASSVAGASCPITPNAMMTRCFAADFLGWVRRIFTFKSCLALVTPELVLLPKPWTILFWGVGRKTPFSSPPSAAPSWPVHV
jgi:hypothetical protein